MIKTDEIKRKGSSYSQYREFLNESAVNKNTAALTPEELEKHEYLKLNIARMNRLDKTYQPSEDILQALSYIDTPQLWLMIAAGWCGDCAQNLPAIARIAGSNPMIELVIIERDDHPEIMDEFLTDGKRSIPVLAVLNHDGNEIFRWGSRPKSAQELVVTLKNNGMEKAKWEKQLHLWYAKNRNRELESELLEKIRSTINQTVG